MTQRGYLTFEVVQRLGVSQSGISRYVRKGVIRRLGNGVFNREDVDRLAEKLTAWRALRGTKTKEPIVTELDRDNALVRLANAFNEEKGKRESVEAAFSASKAEVERMQRIIARLQADGQELRDRIKQLEADLDAATRPAPKNGTISNEEVAVLKSTGLFPEF